MISALPASISALRRWISASQAPSISSEAKRFSPTRLSMSCSISRSRSPGSRWSAASSTCSAFMTTILRSWSGGAHARAMAMVALTAASASITAVLSRLATRAARAVVALSLAAAVGLVQTPLVPLLHIRPLHLDDWGLALAGGALAALPLVLAGAGRRHGRARRWRGACTSGEA